MALLMCGDELMGAVRVLTWNAPSTPRTPPRLTLEIDVELEPGRFELVDEFGARRSITVTRVCATRAEAHLGRG